MDFLFKQGSTFRGHVGGCSQGYEAPTGDGDTSDGKDRRGPPATKCAWVSGSTPSIEWVSIGMSGLELMTAAASRRKIFSSSIRSV